MELRRRTALLLSLLCLLLCACGTQTPDNQDTVMIWGLEGDALLRPLQERIEEYNRDTGGLLPVTLRSFPDEESLAAAFESARPDLLLCDHARAAALYESGVLQDIRAGLGETAPRYPENLSAVFEGLGRSYYPLGAAVILLYADREAANLSAYGDLESLCRCACAYGEKEKKPFFTSDDFSALFYQGMLSWQVEFHGEPERDERSEVYVTLYNLLANGTYEGGILPTDYAGRSLVQAGTLPCAAVWSNRLAGAPEEGKLFAPLPGLREQQELLAWGHGLAVTLRPGRGSRSTVGFLRWLFSEGRADQMALDGGLVPVAEGASPAADSTLDLKLLELGRKYNLHLPDPGGDYWRHRESFESFFRAALERFL